MFGLVFVLLVVWLLWFVEWCLWGVRIVLVMVEYLFGLVVCE